MARPVRLHQLTPDQILALPTPKRTTLTSDGGGLNVQTNASGGRSWLFRYRFGGRERAMGFGPVDAADVPGSLARARERAADARALLAKGIAIPSRIGASRRPRKGREDRSRSASVPMRTLRRTSRRGAIRNIGNNGGTRSPPTCTQSLASCRWPRSTSSI